MNFLKVFMPIFFVAFLLVPFLCYFVRIRNDRLAKLCPPGSRCQRARRRRIQNQLNHLNQSNLNGSDRQGNIFTISDETSNNPSTNHRYPDFFYLEPNSDEAARIRAQLEKDDKDLPSYDDVMRMTSVPTTPMTPPIAGLSPPPPTPAATALPTSTVTFASPPTVVVGNTTSSTTLSSSNSVASTPPAPPPSYSETPPSYEAASSSTTINITSAASTSRGASIAIPITNSASNTSV